ncbi:hypothetical protein GCM10017771_45440 [Streptomyces capitiformicae]|uniref:Uncharacterized protein n=1 Tax=Streptomyces capitiformicae TaxID=2014920 RepID=A0A918YZC8_9ACTN|nr:hypothetical protein GCM10017771_45440 [Streptomyces capitiformicae]
MLGLVAQQALEELWQELEVKPKLGIRRGLVQGIGDTVVYRTRLEPREDMPGLTVVYVYAPQPHPPAVAIIPSLPTTRATSRRADGGLRGLGVPCPVPTVGG